MAEVASKQQTTTLLLFTIVIRPRKHTELTKKTDKPDGKPVLSQRTLSSVFRAGFFVQLNCTVSLKVYVGLNKLMENIVSSVRASLNILIAKSLSHSYEAPRFLADSYACAASVV
jgi:hypothetical protein